MLQKSKRLQNKNTINIVECLPFITKVQVKNWKKKQLNVMRSSDSNKYAMDWCSLALQAKSFEILHIENKLMNRKEMKLQEPVNANAVISNERQNTNTPNLYNGVFLFLYTLSMNKSTNACASRFQQKFSSFRFQLTLSAFELSV